MWQPLNNGNVVYTDEYKKALDSNADVYVPACGGLEKPFMKDGVWYLYVWNPRTCHHAYLNTQTDMLLTDDEAVEVFCK